MDVLNGEAHVVQQGPGIRLCQKCEEDFRGEEIMREGVAFIGFVMFIMALSALSQGPICLSIDNTRHCISLTTGKP